MAINIRPRFAMSELCPRLPYDASTTERTCSIAEHSIPTHDETILPITNENGTRCIDPAIRAPAPISAFPLSAFRFSICATYVAFPTTFSTVSKLNLVHHKRVATKTLP
jgi:hypothetical protein